MPQNSGQPAATFDNLDDAFTLTGPGMGTLVVPDEGIPAWLYQWKSKGGKAIGNPSGASMGREGYRLTVKSTTDWMVTVQVLQPRSDAPEYVHEFDALEGALKGTTDTNTAQAIKLTLQAFYDAGNVKVDSEDGEPVNVTALIAKYGDGKRNEVRVDAMPSKAMEAEELEV